MTVLQISIPEQKEKMVRLLLKEMGVSVKEVKKDESFTKKIKTAVKELNDIKQGKTQLKDFDKLLLEL